MEVAAAYLLSGHVPGKMTGNQKRLSDILSDYQRLA